MFYLSAGEIRRVGQELFLMRYPNATATLVVSTVLVEAATILNVPLSNTQALASAVFGTGISYETQVRLGQAVPADSVKLGNRATAKLHNRVNHRYHLASIVLAHGFTKHPDAFLDVHHNRAILQNNSAFHKSYEQILTMFIFL